MSTREVRDQCRSCVRPPRTWPTKGGARACAQPLNRGCRMCWTDPRTKTDQARARSGATVDRRCHGLRDKGQAWLAVKYQDRFSFQGSRSLAPLRLQRLIPLDRDAAPMPVARARAGNQFHRQSWQTGPTPALGVDDRYQPRAHRQMKDDGAARSRRTALSQLHQGPAVLRC